MLKTLELRWFKRGKIPSSIEQWFNQDCPGKSLGNAQFRIDWYLEPIAPCDYLNIKFREGRLEIKWRQKQLAKIDLEGQWEGRVEQWVKWLCEEESFQDFLPEETAWIAVEKQRSQRQYVLSSESACHIELTQLKAKNQHWWTLGLESTGDRENLDAIAQQVSHSCPETFTEPENAAYPHWLSHQLREDS